jgi:hypothetical protein
VRAVIFALCLGAAGLLGADSVRALEGDADAYHTVVIANQRTALPRLTDTLRTARRYRKRSVAHLMAFRAKEDANFANRGRRLAGRMAEIGRFASAPEFHAVTSGAEFLDALIVASREKPIKNLVVYGHATSTALYMREDIGFYVDVAEVAAKTKVVPGSDEDRLELLHLMGARDLADLQRYLREGHIRFAKDPVIVFAGCEAAGRRDAEGPSLARQFATLLDATVIASIGVTDQSMARSQRARNNEYSRGTWVKFVRDEAPQKLGTRVIDALRYLVPDPPKETPPPQPSEPVVIETMLTMPSLEAAESLP